MGPQAPSTVAFEHAAKKLSVDLKVVLLPQSKLASLYEAPLALIRPDQIVAWRGNSGDDAENVLLQVTGQEASHKT